MKQLIKISFLFIMLFLAIPVYADGDMGAGGRSCTNNCGKAETEISTNTKSANQEQNDSENIFTWIYEQIFELID
jgi:hypothetical protein